MVLKYKKTLRMDLDDDQKKFADALLAALSPDGTVLSCVLATDGTYRATMECEYMVAAEDIAGKLDSGELELKHKGQ